MGKRSGSADLPLHGGRVPAWLGQRMTRLGAVITQAIVLEYGRDELLRRLAHPVWFQSFGAVMGMDWHSSGITTSVLGELKRGLAPLSGELGLHVCGGRGRHSRATPAELIAVGTRVGIDGDALARSSRLVAKVDSAAVQDGFDLYLHGFIVTDDGRWVVVQQGMNGDRKQARRYHWLSEGLESFVDAPHAAVEGANQGRIVNLTDRRAAASRDRQLDLSRDAGPDRIVRELARLQPLSTKAPAPPAQAMLPHLVMPDHHEVRSEDVVERRLHGALAAAADRGPQDFTELLLVPGIGARTVRSLAMVAEVVHGAPCRFSDPARFSLAHGGKDRHPYPVPTRVYDRTIAVMKSAVEAAKLGQDEKLAAIRRLDQQARRLEATATGSFGRGADRGRARPLARVRRPQRVRLGAAGTAASRRERGMMAMADLFDLAALPGLASQDDLISEAEERMLIEAIDATALSPFRFQGWTGKRLTSSYGWRYDFDAGLLERGEPLPEWLLPIRDRAAAFAGLPAGDLVQALLIRYDPGAGIGWHRDRPAFEHVVGLSLGAPATMRFRRRVGTRFERVSVPLPPRGTYHLSGEARQDWEHSIVEMDQARWSITFRSLRVTSS